MSMNGVPIEANTPSRISVSGPVSSMLGGGGTNDGGGAAVVGIGNADTIPGFGGPGSIALAGFGGPGNGVILGAGGVGPYFGAIGKGAIFGAAGKGPDNVLASPVRVTSMGFIIISSTA